MLNMEKLKDYGKNLFFVVQMLVAAFFDGLMVYVAVHNLTVGYYRWMPEVHVENVLGYIALVLWITGNARVVRIIRTHFHTRRVMREVFPEMVQGK